MIIGTQGPAVVISPRTAAFLERHAKLASLRVLVRGSDPHISEQLDHLRTVAENWRRSSTGTTDAPQPEPATSSQWLSTSEAAELLWITPRAVVKAIAREAIPATRVGNHWRLNREDIENHRQKLAERNRK